MNAMPLFIMTYNLIYLQSYIHVIKVEQNTDGCTNNPIYCHDVNEVIRYLQ